MDFDPKKDYYKVLDLNENAGEDEIKTAFRKAAIKHHPDRGGDKVKFQEANEAHQVLSDQKKRQQYDMFRKNPQMAQMGGFGGGGFQMDFGDMDLGDLMGDLFGGGRGRRQQSHGGDDLQVGLVISFDESFLGTTKTIQYAHKVIAADVHTETCSTCRGHGVVTQQAQTFFGVMQTQRPCPTCGGTGTLYTKDGKRLAGGGLESKKETIDVKIPAGIRDGVFIKFSGRGDQGMDGSSGDLYIKIQIKKSDLYERHDNDLYVTVDVSIFDLVLGGEVLIPHPEGSIKVKIPKATQLDSKVKVTGKGFGEKGVFSTKGDLYIIPHLIIPKKLSGEQEVMWEKLRNV